MSKLRMCLLGAVVLIAAISAWVIFSSKSSGYCEDSGGKAPIGAVRRTPNSDVPELCIEGGRWTKG